MKRYIITILCILCAYSLFSQENILRDNDTDIQDIWSSLVSFPNINNPDDYILPIPTDIQGPTTVVVGTKVFYYAYTRNNTPSPFNIE